MQLSRGARLGPYEILAPIGAGGMGEVWRARDTRLERDVAIKILPASFAGDPQLRMRFEREAKVISSLNHPHICTVHDVGHESGVHFLVMELIEGESLGDRIAKGPLPPDQVMRFGAQIATALAAAHKRGIVHRDLKPGNVMITPSGAKLLDFGLAKATTDGAVDGFSPTEARPLTAEGTIVGTFQYMAPEQLEGLGADARTDIFALGAVLYEMATGRRAFGGKTKTSVMAAIVSGEPQSISEVQPHVPLALSRVIGLCLRKDPDERWQSAHDVRLELESLLEATPAPASRRIRAGWLAGAAAVTAALLLGFYGGRWQNVPQNAEVTHLSVLSPTSYPIEDLALSPNGRLLALTAPQSPNEPAPLWFRDLRSGETRAIDGTAGAHQLFWSPDGQYVAFMRGTTMQRVAISGGAVESICDISEVRGATWGSRGTIVFADGNGALSSVNASGGEVRRIQRADGAELYWPSFLPDGESFLALAYVQGAAPTLVLASLDASQPIRPLVRAISRPSYAAPGSVLFVKSRTLFAQGLDVRKGSVSGEPVALAHNIDDNDFNWFVFSSSAEGTLAYRSRDVRSQLHLRDRNGKELARFGEPADWVGVKVSPDGSRALLERVDEDRRNGRLWILDLTSGATTRLASSGGWQVLGAWAPDGERFAFTHNPAGKFALYTTSVNSTIVRKIADVGCHPQSWVGDWISCESGSAQTAADIILVSASTGETVPVAATEAWENSSDLSPDGKWIAYMSSEGGTPNMFVQPIPPNGQRWSVSSTCGGPAWTADGKAIYCSDVQTIFALPVHLEGGTFRAGAPLPLSRSTMKPFKNRMRAGVLADGEKFLFNEPVDDAAPAHVLLNWPALLPE